MATLKYLTKVTKAYLSFPIDDSCPFCHHTQAKVLGRKYLLVQLRKCDQCGLMFRFPKEQPEENLRFYQSDYKEGLTTDLPDELSLKDLLENKFHGSSKDFSEKINLVKSYISTGKLLDYGCSWGYGVWQFKQAGYDSIGFEISQPRADFGRKVLGVDIISRQDEINNLEQESFDIIFSSHVIEHLPDISDVFQLFRRLLKTGGILAISVPNCNGCDISTVLNKKKSFAFGEKHTIAYDFTFLSQTLENHQMSVRFLKEDSYEIQVIAQKL
ncbi:methyltransferase domain-containing protein [Anabaena sphaerica FACHB-251]|uniref:Methyltransferase domain-containing protein n=1 Tax=Anabaena sphaerica FACHB-251 TaxID=2692883 RepID=A0A926ZZG5_9NOST|nr:class I SAM-dependent methyltransferase [Anabaena sphaerica]MBD2292373.1 methyltransferase domain-containing protein [Anabaena sphaerica FACHB-251]